MVNQLKLPNRKKILVLGDLILDVYTLGVVSRVSPEAPISVLLEKNQERKLGGACNVAKNLISLGMDVTLAGRVGNDQEGKELIKQVSDQGIASDLIITDHSVPTTTKNRFIATNQQMLRVDREVTIPLSDELEQQFLTKVMPLIASFDAIVFSDYAKGFLTPVILQTLIQEAKKQQLPTIVDPKGKDFSKYCGSTVIKPNEKEAYLATPYAQEETLKKAAQHLLQDIHVDALFITRASKGISIYTEDTEDHFSVAIHDVIDVTGAGDTVLSMLSACIANEMELSEAAKLANIAASISIEHLGCVSITMQQMHHRMLKMDGRNKLFNQSSEKLLTTLLRDKSFAVVAIEDESISMELFEKIKSKKKQVELVICSVSSYRPIVEVLQSIDCVDYITVGIKHSLLKPKELAIH